MKMWKIGLLFVALLILLCGCRKKIKNVEVIEPVELAAFSFSHSGSMAEDNFYYSATKKSEGIQLYTEQSFSGGDIVDTMIQEPILDELGELAGRYRLDLWNGYDESAEDVLDGSGFSLHMVLTDGTEISARGNNAFPEGYDEASSEICRIFETVSSLYEPVEPLPVAPPVQESEIPIFFAVEFFTGEYEKMDSRFRFGAQTQKDGSTRLIIYIWNYPEYENGAEYLFEGYCDSFPYEEIRDIVSEYDILSLSGWYGDTEDKTKEQYSMNFEYDSEGYANQRMITIAGGDYPKNYEAIRAAFLELLTDFILENQEAFYS